MSSSNTQSTITIPYCFPVELERLIFEIAARADGESARQLVIVARHVRNWIEPILYECIIARSQRHATLLLETLSSRQNYLATNVVSLGIGESVNFQQSKAILAACSQNIVNFAVWTSTRNPSIFLPYIRSRSIRRLSLRAQHASELCFPHSLLTSLTHLMILKGPFSWFQMREAARYTKGDTAQAISGGGGDYHNAASLFKSLTHFAVCSQNWGSMQSMLKIGENLRYFVVIVPPHFKAITIIAQRIQEIGDRRVVVLEHSHSVEGWEASVRGETSVWERAEKLVREGYFAERGDVRKWT